jgi:tetratricopeptide (TPR) repeat protein
VQISGLQSDFKQMREMYRDVLTVIINKLAEKKNHSLNRWYTHLADCLQESGQYDEARKNLLAAINSTESEDPDEKMQCNFQLAWHYICHQQNMRDEAGCMLIAIREAGTDEVSGQVDPYYAYCACLGLGRLAEKRGEEEAAIAFYYLQAEAAGNEWGVDSSAGLQAASYLADYLRSSGREEDAVEVESRLGLTDEFSELSLG